MTSRLGRALTGFALLGVLSPSGAGATTYPALARSLTAEEAVERSIASSTYIGLGSIEGIRDSTNGFVPFSIVTVRPMTMLKGDSSRMLDIHMGHADPHATEYWKAHARSPEIVFVVATARVAGVLVPVDMPRPFRHGMVPSTSADFVEARQTIAGGLQELTIEALARRSAAVVLADIAAEADTCEYQGRRFYCSRGRLVSQVLGTLPSTFKVMTPEGGLPDTGRVLLALRKSGDAYEPVGFQRGAAYVREGYVKEFELPLARVIEQFRQAGRPRKD